MLPTGLVCDQKLDYPTPASRSPHINFHLPGQAHLPRPKYRCTALQARPSPKYAGILEGPAIFDSLLNNQDQLSREGKAITERLLTHEDSAACDVSIGSNVPSDVSIGRIWSLFLPHKKSIPRGPLPSSSSLVYLSPNPASIAARSSALNL